MRRHPTQADVAARAGVSRALVSMALSGRPEVAESTRELILRASQEIGYLVNAHAADLARRRTKLLGVVLQDVSNPFFCEVAAHVQDAAAAAGLTTLLNDGRRDATREARAVKTFLQLRVDGLIIVSPLQDATALAAIGRQRGGVLKGRDDDQSVDPQLQEGLDRASLAGRVAPSIVQERGQTRSGGRVLDMGRHFAEERVGDVLQDDAEKLRPPPGKISRVCID